MRQRAGSPHIFGRACQHRNRSNETGQIYTHSLKLIQLPQHFRSYLSKLETRANVLPLIYQDEICLIFNNLTSESLELENACLQASVHRLPET